MKKFFTFVVGILLAFFTLFSSASALNLGFESLSEPSPKIIISEVKVGGDNPPDTPPDLSKDYIELFNASNGGVDMNGWVVERAKENTNIVDCSLYEWTDSDNPNKIEQYILGEDTEEYYIEANSAIVIDEVQLTDDDTNSVVRLIELTDESGAPIQHDLVGWGDASCYEGEPIELPPDDGTSLQRYMDCAGVFPIDSGNNFADFAINQAPSPGVLAGPLLPECAEEEEPPVCTGIVLSEILPNPAGVDTGKEFIEIHNPTDETISLLGCSLRLNETGKEFALPYWTLGAGKYLAFYDSETKITLPNASADTVWLLSTFDEEGVLYPDALSDDVAWALIDGKWQSTLKPTPNKPNELVQKSTGGGIGGGSGLKPCRSDQFRNPATNRCKLRDSLVSQLKPCRPDQFRNPETNRCKLKFNTTSQLKPCDPDQFRNPETNRCKKKDSGSTLKPCNPGQERNPATNRCRKVQGASTGSGFAKVQDIKAPLVSGSKSWWLAGAAGAGVAGYAGWEWRREVSSFFGSVKKKLSG
jgi:hypothetical protein